MINLLPADNKKEIRAGHANVTIMHYLIMLIIALGLLAGIVGVAYVTQSNLRNIAKQRVAEANSSTSSYESIQQEAETFRSNLSTAKQILDKEVKYSDLMIAIAKALPSNVYLDSLALDAGTLGEPMTLSASAKTVKDAQKLKASFESEENSNLFTDVHYLSIAPQTASADGSRDSYPIKISLSVTIKKDAV